MPEKSLSFSIKNWSQDDQPREKLLYKGKGALSDAELVAILIGSGNKDESAVALCKRILASADHNLSELGKLSIKQLTAPSVTIPPGELNLDVTMDEIWELVQKTRDMVSTELWELVDYVFPAE